MTLQHVSKSLIVLSLAILFPTAGIAQTKTKKPQTPKPKAKLAMPQIAKPNLPALEKPNPLKLPEIVQKELPNGVKLVILEDHSTPALWIRLALPAGSIRDPKDRTGLAQMTAAMLDKGTQTRTETQIADKIDGLGASLGAGTDNDFLTVSATGLSVYHDTLFELISDITLRPIFPKEELERVRTQSINSVTSALGDAGTLADAVSRRVTYGDHPYGNFESGTEKSLSAITKEDLLKYHETYFAPNAATLFIVGDITVENAVKEAGDAFGGWQKHDVPALPGAPKPTAGKSDKPEITIIDRPGAAQTQIRITQMTAGYNDPQRVAARVASAVLGLGQFESRLMKEIRVKRGLTYGAGSSFSRSSQAGAFTIGTFTKNVSTGQVIQIALDEANKLITEPIPGDELEDRKAYLNGFFSVSVATTPGVLSRLVPATLYGAGAKELTDYTSKIQQISNSQIREVMTGLNLKNVKIVLVGDAKEIEEQVKSMGTINKISSDDLDLLSPTLKSETKKEVPAPGSLKSDLNAETLVLSSINAHGGDPFLSLKSLVMKGTGELSPPGQELKLPITKASLTFAAGKSRYDLDAGFVKITIGSNGKDKGWLVSPQGVGDAPPGFADPTELIRNAAHSFAAKDGKFIANLATEIDDSRKGLKGVILTDAAGKAVTLYFDADSGLLRETTAGAKGTGVKLGDYKKSEGLQLPGTIVFSLGGKPFVTLKLTEYEINKGVDDNLFARPAK